MEDIFIPVVEASMIYACHYCKASGRSTITAADVEYGLKYAARNTVGKHLGTHFPELYDENSDSDSDISIVDDTDEPFTRYQGTEKLYVDMNECFDTWDEWVPEIPAEKIIKNAIDTQKDGGLHTNIVQ